MEKIEVPNSGIDIRVTFTNGQPLIMRNCWKVGQFIQGTLNSGRVYVIDEENSDIRTIEQIGK